MKAMRTMLAVLAMTLLVGSSGTQRRSIQRSTNTCVLEPARRITAMGRCLFATFRSLALVSVLRLLKPRLRRLHVFHA